MPVCIKKAQTPHLDLRFLPPVNRQPFIQLSCNDTSDFPNQRIFFHFLPKATVMCSLIFFVPYILPLSHFCKVSRFAGWQAPFMAQPAHPQPQDDFPFLLLRTILTIIAATTRTKTMLMMIVAIFSISHVSIEIPPVSLL